MLRFNCDMCGGIMEVDSAKKEAICPYCGNTMLIELAKGEKEKFNIVPENTKTENNEPAATQRAEFYTSSGDLVQVDYFWQKVTAEYTQYVSSDHVIFHFSKEQREYAAKYSENVKAVRYPDEAVKKKLHFYLPQIIGEYSLRQDEYLIVIKKLKNSYPLEKMLGIDQRHMAWMISRLENLSCLLEYSGLEFPNLSVEDVFFEPEHHQILLFGGWQKVQPGRSNDKTGKAIRQIAREIVGGKYVLPKDLKGGLKEFIESVPRLSATNDFSYWDNCLDKAFGERKFVELKVTAYDIYGQPSV